MIQPDKGRMNISILKEYSLVAPLRNSAEEMVIASVIRNIKWDLFFEIFIIHMIMHDVYKKIITSLLNNVIKYTRIGASGRI